MKVVPIFKKCCDETSPETYRPTNLFCSIRKIFGKFLYSRMVHFFVENKVFTKEQFGFRKKDPAFMQIVTLLTTSQEKLTKKN